MNRVTLFRDVAGERVEVCSVEYDSETTLSAEALESTGIPEVVALAQQSYRCDGEGWALNEDGDLTCGGYTARIETIGGDAAPGEVVEMAKNTKKNEPPKPPTMKVETFTRDLKVTLTPAEVAQRADRAARLLEERDKEEAELKAYATTVKSKIATKEAEMRELSAEVRTKFTYREVECERRFLFSTGCVQEVRLDTGEVVSERAMTEKEKQRDLPFLKPGTGEIVDNDPFGVEDTAAE